MSQTHFKAGSRWRAGLRTGLLLLAALAALFLVSLSAAQETPEVTPEETEAPTPEATPEPGPVVESTAPDEVIAVGEEFIVEVRVSDVEHLAAFSFTLEYNSELMSYQETTSAGDFLSDSARGDGLQCLPEVVEAGSVSVDCGAVDLAVCLGGADGASGEGRLAEFRFMADNAGLPLLAVAESVLILDDVEPCLSDLPLGQEIPHEAVDGGIALVRPGHELQETTPIVQIEVDAIEPVPGGTEFEARVTVTDVENLGGFDFTVAFDPEQVTLIRTENEGEFLGSGEREEVLCSGVDADPGDAGLGEDVPPAVSGEGSVTVFCNLLGAPYCLGSLAGPSGSGLLATLVFEARGNGGTDLRLAEAGLVLDDIAPCGPDASAEEISVLAAQRIQHRREDLSVELEGGSGSSTVLIGVIAGVVVVVAVAGVGGYLWYRGRESGASA